MATSDRPLPQYLPLQPQSIDNTKTESGKQGDGRSREDTEHLLFSQHPHLPLQQHPARLQHLLPAGMFSNTIGFSPLTCHTLCSSCCLTLCSPCCLTLCSPCCVNLCSPCCPTLCSPCCLTLCSPMLSYSVFSMLSDSVFSMLSDSVFSMRDVSWLWSLNVRT